MTTYLFEGRMTALSSISHNGGQSFGITSKLRREKFVQPDGSVEEVPVISGNGIRGMLRDRGMLHMCRALGYGEPDQAGKPNGLTLSAFYFLFSGGTLTGAGAKSVDIDYARKIRTLIPLVGIFGGAVGNMILPGKLKCGKAIPICRETAHLLPESSAAAAKASIWDYLQEEMYTRKDDEKNEKLRCVIAPSVRALIDGAKREKAQSAVAVVEETGQSQQMMYYVETFAAGTPLYIRIVLDDVTDAEFSAFLTTLREFSKAPYIGGKSNIGMGEVAIHFDKWVSIDSRAQMEAHAVSAPLAVAYAEHIKQKAADIRKLLGEMN